MVKNQTNVRQNILNVAINLFAQSGYSDVSVRHIAEAVGIKPASLYYHFPNKQSIYFEALEQSFSKQATLLSEVLSCNEIAEKKLERFVYKLTELAFNDPNFRRLLQREMLDGDDARLKYIAENLFKNLFSSMLILFEELSPDNDQHMMTISLISLIIHHLEIAPIRKFLPGYKEQHNQIDYIAKHVYRVLNNSL